MGRPYIIGTGSFVPSTLLDNAAVMAMARPSKRDGQPMPDNWLEKHFGIVTRALDLDPATATKRTREEGGLYDGDFAVLSSMRALADAGVKPTDVDVLVHVSCTPDTVHCGDHLRYITGSLGLRRDVKLTHHDLGCAGVAAGLDSAMMNLTAGNGRKTALVVATNCPSGQTASTDAQAYYLRHQLPRHSMPWTWASAKVFGDGGGAIVLQFNGADDRGLLCTGYETDPETPLVEYPAGGCLYHTRSENIGDHVYAMDAPKVGEVFVPLMQRNMAMLEGAWPRYIKPIVGGDFDIGRVNRWYFHQANGPAVRAAAETLGIPRERYSMNIDRYGNTSAASTLILLDEDRRAQLVRDGNIIVFMWIGAGNGAMNGYAVFVL